MARGGTISGLVTDAVSGEPATGIYACAYSGGKVVGRCDTTYTDGEYTIIGLPTGNYAVRFSPAVGGVDQNFLIGNKDYIPQFDGDVQSEADGDARGDRAGDREDRDQRRDARRRQHLRPGHRTARPATAKGPPPASS